MPNLSSPLFSLSAAAAWGAGDFSGGIATRRSAVFSVVAAAHATGFVFMVAMAVLFREALPSGTALAWASAAGLVGGAGLACLYRALAVGKMGLNAPLSSVVAALVPLVFSFFSEGLPHAWRLAGCVVALLSIWLIAGSSGKVGTARVSECVNGQLVGQDPSTPASSNPAALISSPDGMWLAVVAGFGLGGFLLLIKFAGSTAVFWPLVVTRAGSFGLMLSMILASGTEWRLAPGSLRWVLLAGFLDTGANALYVLALQRGSLAVAAVLSSLYPASTVILARLVLKERWSRLQGIGMAAALVAVAMVSS